MIKKVDQSSINSLADLALKLWPGHEREAFIEEISNAIDASENESYLYFNDSFEAIGFIQLSVRHDYVEGCDSSPVGYIEGIYVEADYRRRGIAQELVLFAEEWSRKHDCLEIASDCELENQLSIDFHLGAGFIEANRIVCFTKKL